MRLLTLACLSLLFVSAARSQTFQLIYSFPNDGSLGEYPTGTMAVGPGGDLYGTTIEGGTGDNGTAFKITTAGAFTSLGSFTQATTGRRPYSRLINIGDGFLYGVAERNTGVSGDPNGTLFKIDPVNGLSVVFQLPGSGATPKFPRALLSVTPGVVHVLGSSPGGFWQVPLNGSASTSFDLPSGTVGAFPYSATRGNDGRIYGTTQGVSFVGTDPNLRGALFRVDANGANLVKLHDCVQATGTSPRGAMVQATDGNFYGTMSAGGTSGKGVIFRLTPDGTYTVIHHLSSLGTPLGDLIQATDGFLYGTAQFSGTNNLGGIFRVSLNGAFTVLHNFNGNNGTRPTAGLTQADDGNLYGAVAEGGGGGKGAIFRVRLNLPPPNRAPVALDDIGVTTGSAITLDVLGNDFDPEGGALAVTAVSTPTFGAATILGDNTIQYEPDPGFAGTDTFTYTIGDPAGLTATATVRIQSDAVTGVVYSGGFNGLLHLDPEFEGNTDSPRAQIFVAIRDTGRFTGYLLTQRKRVPFKGAFDLTDGTAAVRIAIPGKGRAVLFLGFRPEEEATLLAVVFGREIWSGGARPFLSSSLTTVDRHTVVLVPPDGSGLPEGYGYGVLIIRPNGLVSCVGKYGDGTTLSWASTLVAATDGAPLIPVFSEPVAGGVAAGVLDSSDTPSGYDFAGSVRWIRPPGKKATLPYAAGFTGTTAAGVSRYIPRPRNGTLDSAFDLTGDGVGTASLEGGPLADPISAAWSFAPTKVLVTAPLRKLAFNQKNGLVTGTILNGNQAIFFIGVVNQPGNFGAGQFRIGGITGRFELAP